MIVNTRDCKVYIRKIMFSVVYVFFFKKKELGKVFKYANRKTKKLILI